MNNIERRAPRQNTPDNILGTRNNAFNTFVNYILRNPEIMIVRHVSNYILQK